MCLCVCVCEGVGVGVGCLSLFVNVCMCGGLTLLSVFLFPLMDVYQHPYSGKKITEIVPPDMMCGKF